MNEGGSVPTRAPVDELVRVEEHDPDHDRESNDRHAANVPSSEPRGLVSGTVLSHTAEPVNPSEAPCIESGVSATADVLPFLPGISRAPGDAASHARATRPYMTDDADGLV